MVRCWCCNGEIEEHTEEKTKKCLEECTNFIQYWTKEMTKTPGKKRWSKVVNNKK
tara:strand:+ start:149 stop:313 length:165 start_codon:yes stop_codon:yes gene_type:complete